MKALEAFFWIMWIFTLIFLIISFSNCGIFNLTLFFILLILTAIAMYRQMLSRKKIHWLKIMIKNINLRSLEEEISKIEKKQKESNIKFSRFESRVNDFDNYKIEQEKKYRDVVRKVLELDNDFNKKYKLLGETIIKLKKDMKK